MTSSTAVRLRVFNGSHLTLPSSSQQITLRPHQKNAVWRIVQSDNTLLAHVVGAGKTYTMVAAAIELKRLGLATKPMFVVPNHMLAQFSSELLTLYPTANILVAGKEDFEASERARLFSRIATGQLGRSDRDARELRENSGVAEHAPQLHRRRRSTKSKPRIREERADRGTRLVKELERVKKRLTAKLEALSADQQERTTRSRLKNSESIGSSSTKRTSSRTFLRHEDDARCRTAADCIGARVRSVSSRSSTSRRGTKEAVSSSPPARRSQTRWPRCSRCSATCRWTRCGAIRSSISIRGREHSARP